MAAPHPRDNFQVLSSQRKSAPCARTARRKDDVFRSVSWLAGHNPSPPSRTSLLEAQWHFREGLTAYSCGRSFGFGPLSINNGPHRIPICLVDVTAKPEPGNLKPSQSLSQRNPRARKTIREFHDGTCFSRNISISGPMAWGSSRPPCRADPSCAD